MQKSKLRKGLVVAIIVLFVGAGVIPSMGVTIVERHGSQGNKTPFAGFNPLGSTLYVGGSGPNNYTSIQDAIDNASDGDTVFVYDDSSPYYENVVVNKTINLIGENRNNTIIDGSGSGDVVYVSADWVNISGFTIQNSGSAGYPNYDAGVEIWSNYSTIVGNIVTGNNRGIWISANNNSVLDNEITSNNAQGIEIYVSRNNTIAGNNVSSNTKAGIQSDDSSNNTITNNTITSNSWHGVFLDDSSNSNTITSNNISSNDNGIRTSDFSDGNIIYHNNLINNTQNAYDECSNTWDNGYPSGGNYWDDYTGNDTNGDCIGDTPYNITGGDNQDLYPFMYPSGWVNNPPYPPSDPFPEDGGHDVPVTIILNWTGGDPDPCDTVTYDVYFGVTFPPTKKSSNQTGASYYPPALQVCTKYYWQIITWDNHGVCTKGPIWSFTTFCVNLPPDMPVIDGPSSGKAGETYIYSFDANDPEGHDIYYFIDWGDETNTSWLGIYESGEKIYVNHTWSEKGTYEISARAKDVYDAIGDWGTLEVTMPKNKPFFYNSPLLNWLFERFPIIQRLLIALEVFVV